ncbi:MAG TPA: J domain-containing protein [Candidatus Pelagibacter sp.]|jgi:hypothetical protein|nr:J domain-containing protein [Candidatus Pelagibacter sp.]
MKNICEWINCREAGDFKAPAEKDNSRNFKWLCEEHIKLFNKKWNYFEGMSQNEIQDFLKSDLTWHRPTQKFGSTNNYFDILWNNTLSDKFKIFKEEQPNGKTQRKLCEKDKDAFRIMDLEIGADWTTIQKKFKTLVKKFHPDKHSGSKLYEDKLKKITLAYSHLKMIVTTK